MVGLLLGFGVPGTVLAVLVTAWQLKYYYDGKPNEKLGPGTRIAVLTTADRTTAHAASGRLGTAGVQSLVSRTPKAARVFVDPGGRTFTNIRPYVVLVRADDAHRAKTLL